MDAHTCCWMLPIPMDSALLSVGIWAGLCSLLKVTLLRCSVSGNRKQQETDRNERTADELFNANLKAVKARGGGQAGRGRAASLRA